jgi:putative ABC transport system ATP-binding protein
LNLLGGLDVPSSGSITVAGDEITRLSGKRLTQWRARHVGFVFQMYNLIPVLTAYRNVELPVLLTPLPKSERKRHVETALALVGLTDRMQHYPRQLSADSCSAWRSRARSWPTRPSCCATSRPATSTARPPTRSWR